MGLKHLACLVVIGGDEPIQGKNEGEMRWKLKLLKGMTMSSI